MKTKIKKTKDIPQHREKFIRIATQDLEITIASTYEQDDLKSIIKHADTLIKKHTRLETNLVKKGIS